MPSIAKIDDRRMHLESHALHVYVAEHFVHRGKQQHARALTRGSRARRHRGGEELALGALQFRTRAEQHAAVRGTVERHQCVHVTPKTAANRRLLIGGEKTHAKPRGARGVLLLSDELSSVLESVGSAGKHESDEQREQTVHGAFHHADTGARFRAQRQATPAQAAPDLEKTKHPEEQREGECNAGNDEWHAGRARLLYEARAGESGRQRRPEWTLVQGATHIVSSDGPRGFVVRRVRRDPPIPYLLHASRIQGSLRQGFSR